jgi:hypothetical protein
VALQTPAQQAELIESLWNAVLAENGEFEEQVQEHAAPDTLFIEFKTRLAAMGFRLAIAETEPTALPGRAATG